MRMPVVLLALALAGAAQAAGPAPRGDLDLLVTGTVTRAEEADPGRGYCKEFRDAAADARFAWQAAELKKLAGEVEAATAELEVKRRALEDWVGRRETFIAQASAHLVGIYGKMKPDAAAGQLAVVDEATAAALLMQLDARTASAVFGEMEPKRAARLVRIMSGASELAVRRGTRP